MSCSCCEPDLIEVHTRKLYLIDFYRTMTSQNMNPYSEYDKHPIIKREIEMGMAMIRKQNPFFSQVPIITNLRDIGDEQTLVFGVLT